MSRYIDADALKQKYIMVTTRYSGGIMERPAVVLEAIDEAPSIDIDRPQGEWKHTPTYWVYCSVCGEEPPCESNYKSNYCPNCGARMRK